MWFAALGTYQHNPWFVHLLWKILNGSPSVMALLDHVPMRNSNSTVHRFVQQPPKIVRAQLYHYGA
jgi:hypothetical protein